MRFIIAANLLGLPAISVPVSAAYLFLRILSDVLYGNYKRETNFDLHHKLINLTPTNLDTIRSKIYKSLIRRIKKNNNKKVKERKS
jgi:hypothetical protein